jgi:hypothetical protein
MNLKLKSEGKIIPYRLFLCRYVGNGMNKGGNRMAKIRKKTVRLFRTTTVNVEKSSTFTSIHQANLDALKALREIEDCWLKKIYFLFWKRRN